MIMTLAPASSSPARLSVTVPRIVPEAHAAESVKMSKIAHLKLRREEINLPLCVEII